jgi:hypothetical protein
MHRLVTFLRGHRFNLFDIICLNRPTSSTSSFAAPSVPRRFVVFGAFHPIGLFAMVFRHDGSTLDYAGA